MALNYPIYSVKTGARLSYGPPSGEYGGTYGYSIFTGAEFLYLLRHIQKMGFDVYAHSHFGGINLSAHSVKSWHYVKDANGISLGADIGTYGNVNERYRIINELIPLLDKMGVGWHYARNGYVPGHEDHIHIDVSNWGRKGGAAPSYGYYTTYRKANPVTYLGGAVVKRKPRSIAAYYGISNSNLVKVIQRIAGVTADGSYGTGTVSAVKKLQGRLGIRQDGNFGPATARAYMASVGTRREGATGNSVRLIQYVAGLTMDGSYGPGTTKAVKEMQAYAGITVDGVFGATSRERLLV